MICSLCSFYFDKWLLRNIEFWKMFVWKSGRQLPASARVRSTIFPLEGQSNYTRVHCSCEFHSWTPGTSNICFFPAKFWKLQSVCAHVIPTWACLHNILHLIFNLLSSFMPYIIITIIIFSCWAFLVSWLGLWGVPCFWLQVFAKGCGGWKNPVKFVRCHSSPNMKNGFQHSKSNLDWILRCPHPGSWVLGPKSWSPAGNT